MSCVIWEKKKGETDDLRGLGLHKFADKNLENFREYDTKCGIVMN